MANVVDLKDALGVNLHSKVREVTSKDADKITGMLLECKTKQILQMLENKDVLKSYVKIAQETLNLSNNGKYNNNNNEDKGMTSDDDSRSNSSNEMLAEDLYDKVITIVECELMAAKITGMLLDLEAGKLNGLMSSDGELKAAVAKAQSALLENNSDELSPQEEIADEIYAHVEKKYPELAPQITGMLLELNIDLLKKLLTSTTELDSHVEEAKDVFLKSAS